VGKGNRCLLKLKNKMKNIIKNSKKYLSLTIFISFAFVLFFSIANSQVVPTVTVTANPSSVGYKGTSIINWTSTGANYCTVSGIDAGNDATGSFITPPLSFATTYTVSCSSAYACFSDYSPQFDGQCAAQTTNDDCLSETHKIIPTGEPVPICSWGPTASTVTKSSSTTVNVNGNNTNPAGFITNVETEKAEPVRWNYAKLWANLNPNNNVWPPRKTIAYFRYSQVDETETPPIFCNDVYGSKMERSDDFEVWGNVNNHIDIEVNNLLPSTPGHPSTYYYCVVVSSDKEIVYGKVKSFTTWATPPEDPTGGGSTNQISVTTKSATVVDGGSVYLKGTFYTEVPAHTWFEYRKKGTGTSGGTTGDGNPFSWSEKINEKAQFQNQNSGNSGELKFLLEGLYRSTKYEYRAVIKDDNSNNIKYGVITSFTTKNNGGLDPAALLPDLIASKATPATATMGTPVNLTATIKNKGEAPTGTSFNNFFQITSKNPGVQIETTPLPTALDNFLKIFNIKKAFGATTSTGDITSMNLPPIPMSALGIGASATTTQAYTFTSSGTYFFRACADKKNRNDAGKIKESFENNNCGPWSSIKVVSSSEMPDLMAAPVTPQLPLRERALLYFQK